MNINPESKIFTFQIHLPEGIEKIGQPVVLGDIKELGFWQKPIVKLCQPFLENPTYWQSEPITISISKIPEYRFAIHVQNPAFHGNEEKNIFEGNGDKDNRILDIERENQFAIWKNNSELNQKLNINLDKIQDYAFVNYIFNSITSYNLKENVIEYQYLLNL